MTGEELLLKIILSLNSYLGFNDVDLIGKVEVEEDLEGSIKFLTLLSPPYNYIKFLNSLEKLRQTNEDDFLNTSYPPMGNINTIDFTEPLFDKKNRRIAYNGPEFGFFSSDMFFDSGNIIDISEVKYSILWMQFHLYCQLCYLFNDNISLFLLFDCIRDNNVSPRGFVINKNAIPFKKEDHYSYIYLSYLNNGNTITLSNDLIYTNNLLNSLLTLDDTKNYDQYFDIYDVLNELNQAPDILSRFLKLYHILEYLVYRVYLVDLVRRVGDNKFFVREFIIASENMKKGESESFSKNFQTIFASNVIYIQRELNPIMTPDIGLFLGNKNIVRGFMVNDLKKIANLLYGIRCCIVHNKESEYHMTISNYDDFKVIIPLIKKVITTFEYLIIDKLKLNDITTTYPQKQINLY